MDTRTMTYENLENARFFGVGKYDIPVIAPEKVYEMPELIGFNYAKSGKAIEGKGCHFFLSDYQFERVWRNPNAYIENLKKFRLVFSPDFSLYTDFPKAMQIYNHYRKHWLAAYWQSLGMTVIPTVGWSDSDSFDWCFDGEPHHSAVAVSSVGTQANSGSKQKFLDGYSEMLKRLEPETVIFYGSVPKECYGNIIRVRAFQEKFREVKICD